MKKPFSVGYFSSYDRGLETLLTMWPKIKEQVPEATLDIAYGWTSFDYINANNPEKMQWKFHMMQLMKQDGVTEHGRLSHIELAKLMKSIQVWAYPTEFTEIHCITALKAAEAGCYTITTGVAALEETAPHGEIIKCDDIYTNTEAQDKFIAAVVSGLKAGGCEVARVENRYWPDVAKVWNKALA